MSSPTSSSSRHSREFTLPGDPNAIPPVIDAVLSFLQEASCRAFDEAAISLALQEGLSNAVVHGCGNDPGKSVSCSAQCDNGSLVIVIRDPGPGFDSAVLSNPLTPEGVAKTHGRGIHLMRNLMDEVRFEENGTRLVLRKS